MELIVQNVKKYDTEQYLQEQQKPDFRLHAMIFLARILYKLDRHEHTINTLSEIQKSTNKQKKQ